MIGEIRIRGNRKTRAYIIERELTFKRGDTLRLDQLLQAFRLAREQLINIHLFNDAIVYVQDFRGHTVDIAIDVKERWYLFPLPYVRPADRNLSVWSERDYSLSRLNYGMKLSWYNFTGRNDYLRAWFITGYSRQLEAAYDLPFFDRALKQGLGMSVIYSEQKELNVLTAGNRQYFINSDTIPYSGKYLYERMNLSLRYYYRPALHTRHFIRLSFNKVGIDSAVTVWNPHYFQNANRTIFYPELSYTLNYSNADYIPYPLKGILLETGLTRKGVNADMNLWQLYARLTRSWPIAYKTYFNFWNWSMLKLPLDQPFYNQQFLGYGDLYMRGLDKYVVDGVAGSVIRNSFLRELYSTSLPFTRIPSHDRIPIRIYARAFADCGYIYNRDFTANSLTNRMLYTAGLGLDFVTFYDLTLKFDYSFNQLGQNGLFLHIRNDF
ncbi:MAG: POTRA domain-containing protein [Puia sp.]|nr:POTRA domain-containing protein [Puia sp.]